MAYFECHMGSTFDGSVRLKRFKARREIYCVVSTGEMTFVLGSASNEYKHVLWDRINAIKENSKATHCYTVTTIDLP